MDKVKHYSGFEQQRQIHHDEVVTQQKALDDRFVDDPVYLRMGDFVELFPFLDIVENYASQCLSVQLATVLVKDRLSKRCLNFMPRGATRFNNCK